jgi:hypothetical protein
MSKHKAFEKWLRRREPWHQDGCKWWFAPLSDSPCACRHHVPKQERAA